jgi:hypothetical protein
MKKMILYFVFFMNTFIVYAQQKVFFEKIAFDFFVSNIMCEHYKKGAKFNSNLQIANEISGTLYTVCFQDYYEDYLRLNKIDVIKVKEFISTYRSKEKKLSSDLVINSDILISNKKKVTKKIKYLSVNQAEMYVSNLSFVELIVFDKNFENRFFIEIDINTNKVTRYCKKIISY